jgi:hypothetical protein
VGAKSATVTRLSRNDDGTVSFTAVLDDTGDKIDLDNRNVSPDKVWEIHPDFVETFRNRVTGVNDETHSEDVNESFDDDFRSSFQNHVESLDERLKRMETAESELERTIASAVRELAGDLMRTYRGEEPEFAYRYADRYDLALTKSSLGHENDKNNATDFRGGESKKSKNYESPKRHQDEKYSFDVEPLSYELKESSVLSE